MMLLKGCGVEEKCAQKVLLQKKKKKKMLVVSIICLIQRDASQH